MTRHNSELDGWSKFDANADSIRNPSQKLEQISPENMPSRTLTYKGKTYASIKAFALAQGLSYGLLVSRLARGWSLAQALGTASPPKRISASSIEVEYKGRTYTSLTDLSEYLGIDPDTFRARLYRGLSIAEAAEGYMKPRLGNRKEFSAFGRRWSSHKEFAAEFGISSSVISRRLARGWTLQQSVGLDPPPPRFRNFEGHARDSKFKESRISQYSGTAEPVPDNGGFKLYLIRNKRSNKVYVGITIGALDARLRQHFSAAKRGRKTSLCNAIKKYGESSFKIELIRDDARSFLELQEQEVREIESRNSINKGYNTAVGGSLGTVKPTVVKGLKFQSRAQAAEYFGIDQGVFNLRLNRLGWTPEQAAELEMVEWDGKSIPITLAGVSYSSINAACTALSLKYKKVISRISDRGWTLEQAFGLSPAPATAVYTGKPIMIGGIRYPSIKNASEVLGFNSESFRKSLGSGRSPDEVFSRLRVIRKPPSKR